MVYYHYEQREQMKNLRENQKKDETLQKYFSDGKKWGACILFNENGKVENIEISKLTDVTQNHETWNHYANILLWDDGTWEVNSQFNGKNEDEMWIFGYYKRFADAVRRVQLGIENLKVLKVY